MKISSCFKTIYYFCAFSFFPNKKFLELTFQFQELILEKFPSYILKGVVMSIYICTFFLKMAKIFRISAVLFIYSALRDTLDSTRNFEI